MRYYKPSFLSVLSFAFALGTFLPEAKSQDVTPPTVAVKSYAVIVIPKDFDDFIFVIDAADETAIDTLEIRASVNGNPPDPWQEFPFIQDYPIVYMVHCNRFRFDVRSRDTSGNYSNIITREFKAPFTSDSFGLVGASSGVALQPNAPIENPPSVIVIEDTAILNFQKFKLPRTTKVKGRGQIAAAKKPTPKKSIVYVATYTNITTGTPKRVISKKNSLTLKKLPSGIYSTTYHAEVKQGRKIISSTQESPAASFEIVNPEDLGQPPAPPFK